MKLLQYMILRMHERAELKERWYLHERVDSYYYAASTYIPRILGTDIRQLGLRLTLDLAMWGIGGLMGIAVATSCLVGMVINFVVLAPIMIEHGDIVARIGPTGSVVPISRSEIVNQWSLWWGVTMMVVGSFVSLLARPKLIASAFKGVLGKKTPGADLLKDIEFPIWISVVGIPIMSVAGALVSHAVFCIPWVLSLISLPLIFLLSGICAKSMALTSWTPTRPLIKITQ